MLLRRWSIKGSAIACCYCLLLLFAVIACCYCLLLLFAAVLVDATMRASWHGGVMAGWGRERNQREGPASCYCFLLLLAPVLSKRRWGCDGMAAWWQQEVERGIGVGRSSFLLLLPAIACCCVVEAPMRAWWRGGMMAAWGQVENWREGPAWHRAMVKEAEWVNLNY